MDGGEILVPPTFTDPQPKRAVRWSFAPRADTKCRDVLIEGRVGGAFKAAARFTYDPVNRVWEGPAGGDDQFWKVGTDPDYRGRFTTLKTPTTEEE